MSDDYATDAWLLQIFNDWFDPCELHSLETRPEFDGLIADWHDPTFVNPPYSDPKPWVQKAIRESNYGIRVVMLLKHDSSTEWYRLLHEAGAHFLMINGRMKHGTGKSANFPSVLVVL